MVLDFEFHKQYLTVSRPVAVKYAIPGHGRQCLAWRHHASRISRARLDLSSQSGYEFPAQNIDDQNFQIGFSHLLGNHSHLLPALIAHQR